jgi:SpoVK/Ycf46/Vps4 family AAA+-type ATPase
MSYFLRNGNTWKVASEESMDLHGTLPAGNYTLKEDMFGNKFLEMVDSFPEPSKLYGDTTKNATRILNTFLDRPTSTGVMLNGEKGSGKTLLAKVLSIRAAAMHQIPTIIINQPWTGDAFNKFLQDIEQPCIVMFDEFEKVYDNEHQEAALTLLDGVFPSKKLFIITCNDKWRVNEHMRNRPGRIYYMLDFKGLDAQFIREYCEDNLKAKEHIERITNIAVMFDSFNFDMLKALVEEMNRYDETPAEALKMLNAKPEYASRDTFDIKVSVLGVEPKNWDKKWRGNPLTDKFSVDYWMKSDGDDSPRLVAADEDDLDVPSLESDDDGDWHSVHFTPNDIKRVDNTTGEFIYANNEGVVVSLKREKVQSYNWLAF